MKNSLIISISDVKGTKSYKLHQIVKKFLLVFIIVIFLVIGASFFFISYLNKQIIEVKNNKKKELAVLVKKEEELKQQNNKYSNLIKQREEELKKQDIKYSQQIKRKIKDIEELSSKLDEIHTIIGTNIDSSKEEINQKVLDTINTNKKKYTLLVIPNGKPLEKIKISSPFGYRKNPITKRRQFHRGIDLSSPKNTPIKATADGIVEFVQARNIGDYGRVIKIIHNFGFKTVFAHMKKVLVKVGEVVQKGQIIGLVGSSGRSTASHLHYEVRYANKVLNPLYFLRWNINKYDEIFKKVRRVEWESLINQINEQLHQTQLQ